MSSILRATAADTSFIINLIATTRARQILDGVAIKLLIPPIVRAEVKRDRAALEELVAAGYGEFAEFPNECQSAFTIAARSVQDGEAEAIALGLIRNTDLVTDDGYAVDTWDELARDMGVTGVVALGICEILQKIECTFEVGELQDILGRIRRDAHFEPPKEHREWWSGVLPKSK